MFESDGMHTLMRAHKVREAVHSELFAYVAPQALGAQDSAWAALLQREEKRRARASEAVATAEVSAAEGDGNAIRAFDALAQRMGAETLSNEVLRVHQGSRAALATTLQPVRDVVIEAILILPEDRQLDIIGAPYPNFWMSKAGNALPALQIVSANPSDGSMGFAHQVKGTVTGVQASSGAGLYVQFVPRIAPGIAQVRPYLPFMYQWSSLSFRSREDNLARFGIRVWSWDLAGKDMAAEQDYGYFVWNDTIIAQQFGTSNSPSWTLNQDNNVPEWDDDYGLKYDKTAPYFKTRASRIYMTAIWCSGMCWSVSRENRPGQAIGRLAAQMPLVVIGYQ